MLVLKKNVTAAVDIWMCSIYFQNCSHIPVKCQVTMVTGCGKYVVGSDGHCCPGRVPLVQM